MMVKALASANAWVAMGIWAHEVVARAVHGIGLTGPTRFVAATTAHSLEPHRLLVSHANVAPRVIAIPSFGPLPLFP